MYEGVNASDGIGIGVARVAVEPDLSFTPHAPEDPEAEKARYAAAVEKFVEQTNAQIERMKQTCWARRSLTSPRCPKIPSSWCPSSRRP